jgi:general secretion pathway protein B
VSFILEALRKSEHERQRQAGPGIADLPVARPAPRTPVALIAIGALLAVNLAVLLYFLLRDEAPAVVHEPPRSATTSAAAPQDGGEAAADSTPSGESAAPAPTASAIPAPVQQELRPLSAEVLPEAATPPQSTPPPAPDPSLLPPAPRPQPAARPPVSSSEEILPRLESLPPQATAGLPELRLDLHIYATLPQQRAVFINGRRYGEGDTLPEGAEVQAITTDGAVLRYRGLRFLLPRQ